MIVAEDTFRTTPEPLLPEKLVEPAPVVYMIRPNWYVRELEASST